MFLKTVLVLFSLIKCHCYENWSPPLHHQRIPQDVMADVVNNLGIKMLAIHNLNNDNNIAISPYGILSILIALGEGLKGDASHEILQSAQIPPDISLIRIGLRDIHRHLKSYFIPEEGFLAGISLNHENVSLNQQYEEILQFYGYDFKSFKTFQSSGTAISTTTSTEIEINTTEETTITTLNVETTETTTVQETTMMTTGTEMSSTISTAKEEIQTTASTIEETTNIPSTLPVTTSRTQRTDNAKEETTEIGSTLPVSTERTQKTMNTKDETTEMPSTLSGTTLKTSTETAKMMTATITETTTEMESTTMSTNTESTTSDAETTTIVVPKQKLVTNRTKRSIVDYLIARYYDDQVNNQHSYVAESQKTFYINEKYREGNINFMTYDTILPFYFVSHLNALALRFPLDSSKYYLLLLLPVDEMGIDQLVCDLGKTENGLRYIVEKLRYARVQAIIPSFMLKGNVVLTSTLQKLGIQRIFEPRQADFSLMTTDPEVYVTNVEQAITVTIRNYVDPSMENSRNLHQYDPVNFKADHPFLYFVLDAELDVALMAGKIINPLNSRIR